MISVIVKASHFQTEYHYFLMPGFNHIRNIREIGCEWKEKLGAALGDSLVHGLDHSHSGLIQDFGLNEEATNNLLCLGRHGASTGGEEGLFSPPLVITMLTVVSTLSDLQVLTDPIAVV